MRPPKPELMAALYGRVSAGRYSAHAIDAHGGSPTLTGVPERPPASAPRP
jgi:hypothetical protein